MGPRPLTLFAGALMLAAPLVGCVSQTPPTPASTVPSIITDLLATKTSLGPTTRTSRTPAGTGPPSRTPGTRR